MGTDTHESGPEPSDTDSSDDRVQAFRGEQVAQAQMANRVGDGELPQRKLFRIIEEAG
jgi:hypothetical protein